MLSIEVKSCCGQERLVTQGTIFSDGVEAPSKERRGKRRRDISEKEETASAMLDRVERHTGVGLGAGVSPREVGSWRTRWKMENGKWKMENPSVEIFDSPNFQIDAVPAFHPSPPDGTELDITLCRPCQLFLSSLECCVSRL